jgi:glutathione peroxidase
MAAGGGTLGRRAVLAGGLALAVAAGAAGAAGAGADSRLPAGLTFASIDGGEYRLDDWRGRPILIVNTASLCGFARQFADLQALQDAYGPRGLVVLAVPSNDFRQELATEAEVKSYCELTFGIDLPMTTITHVRGEQAHPLFRWLAQDHGFQPGWNFNKVLIGADGRVLGTWGSAPSPLGSAIQGAVRAALGL